MQESRDSERSLADRLGLLDYFRKWIIVGGLTCAVAALIISLLLPKIYRATTFLLISESRIGQAPKDTNLQQMAMLPTFVPFVDNDALIEESLKKLSLDHPPYSLTVDTFREKGYLDVRIPKSTRLLELNVEFPDAAVAASLANELAQGAVRFNDRLNAADTKSTQEFLWERLGQARDLQEDSAEQRLQAIDDAQIEQAEKDFTILLNEKEMLATRLQQLRLQTVQSESRTRSLEEMLKNEATVIPLRRSITSDRFLERTAELAFANDEPLSVTEESINETREKIRRDLVESKVNLSAQSAEMKAAGEQLEAVNQNISQLSTQLAKNRSRIEAANQDYSVAVEATRNAAKEYQAASVTVGSKSQDIKQIAPALVPEHPVRPKVLINTLLGFLLGMLLTCAYVLATHRFRESQDRESAGLEDMEGLPVASLQRR